MVCHGHVVYFVYRLYLNSVKKLNLHCSIILSTSVLSLFIRFPHTSMCGSGIHYSQSTGTLSSLILSLFACKYPCILEQRLPYCTTHRGSSFHHILFQCPTPVILMSTYFNKFAVLVSYVLCPHCQFRLSALFPVFFPCTQTRYECMFRFLACLSSTVARS